MLEHPDFERTWTDRLLSRSGSTSLDFQETFSAPEVFSSSVRGDPSSFFSQGTRPAICSLKSSGPPGLESSSQIGFPTSKSSSSSLHSFRTSSSGVLATRLFATYKTLKESVSKGQLERVYDDEGTEALTTSLLLAMKSAGCRRSTTPVVSLKHPQHHQAS